MSEKSLAADADQWVGTYKLMRATRTDLETGQVMVEHLIGFITYGPEGRMMALIVGKDRPKPASIDKITDQNSIELFRSIIAYGGSYEYDGMAVEHHIDISSNEVWTGTTQIRDVKRDGSKIILTTRPAASPFDGKLVSTTLEWEKVR